MKKIIMVWLMSLFLIMSINSVANSPPKKNDNTRGDVADDLKEMLNNQINNVIETSTSLVDIVGLMNTNTMVVYKIDMDITNGNNFLGMTNEISSQKLCVNNIYRLNYIKNMRNVVSWGPSTVLKWPIQITSEYYSLQGQVSGEINHT